jgi:uncharacterized membrane protein
MSSSASFPSVDRTAFSVAHLSEEGDERVYWASKPHWERILAVEVSRRAVYDYDPSSTRLQRVLEVTQLSRG